MRRNVLFVTLMLAAGVVLADDAPKAKPETGAKDAKAQPEADAKEVSGMSILGNQEAPKALVIVPWKSSEIGDSLGIQTMLDDSKQPIDKEVFMRALSYYQIMSETTPHDGASPAPAARRSKS
jgi:hypothetical protein